MTESPWQFNLWSEPWIRVLRRDGIGAELGVGALLAQGPELAALADPSPLVVAGTHRLLVAVLQAIYTPSSLDAIEALLARGEFDPARLAAFAELYQARFDLFHPTMPFLQAGDVPIDGRATEKKDLKPVAYLFSEIPSATNRTLFHHVTDDKHQLCPACSARGVMTIPSFASSGGPSIRPSINGVPPVYVLPAATNLFATLALSLTTPDYQPPGADPAREARSAWNDTPSIAKNAQVSAVGYLESLTFPARRMRLFPQQQPGICTNCGQYSALMVGTMLFEMGHWLSENSPAWEDPFAAYRMPGGKAAKLEDAELRPVRPDQGKALWREYSGLLLAERAGQLRPRIVRQVAALIDRGVLAQTHAVQFRCIGIRTDGKAKIFEWLDEALEAPPALLTDPDGALLVEGLLQLANESEFILGRTFDQYFRPERARHQKVDARIVRFKDVRARMLATFWARLAPEFRHLLFALGSPDQQGMALQGWASAIIRVGRQTFNEAAEQAGERAEALRACVEAQAACARWLGAERKKWLNQQGVEA